MEHFLLFWYTIQGKEENAMKRIGFPFMLLILFFAAPATGN